VPRINTPAGGAGLVEPGHFRPDDAVFDQVEEQADPSAARRVMAATVPSETGVPNSSANAAAVRFLDNNCPKQVEDDRGDPRSVLHRRPRPPVPPQVVVPHALRRAIN
jgi:hypothetical protein